MTGARSGAPPIEVEWQLDAIDLRPVERWLAQWTSPGKGSAAVLLPGLEVVPRSPKRLVDVYLDTPDWRLGRAGYVLRVRRKPGGLEATMKDLATSSDGLRRRIEVTQPLPPEGMAAIDEAGPVGRRIRALAGARPLGEILEVRTRRRPFDLELDGMVVGEVALDQTTIALARDKKLVRLQRVEVEVLPGCAGAFQPMVERLRHDCGLQPAALSKFEAGLLAGDLAIPGAPLLGATGVTPGMTVAELAVAVMRREASVMLFHEPGTRLGEDIEELHQMRVATRRMRAAIDLFAAVLPVRAMRLRSEIGWLAATLGTVRDLDVHLLQFEQWDEALRRDGLQAIGGLVDLLVKERDEAREVMLLALDSRRYERLVADLTRLVVPEASRRSLSFRVPAVICVPELIQDRHDAAIKAARRARRSGLPTDYHRLRIRCKRLRYALEFSSELYGGELRGVARRLARLQDSLGSLQDAEVAYGRLAALVESRRGEELSNRTVFAVGVVAERYRRQGLDVLEALPGRLKALGGHEWRRAEKLMERRRAAVEAAIESARAEAHEAARARAAMVRVLRSATETPVEPGAGGTGPGDTGLAGTGPADTVFVDTVSVDSGQPHEVGAGAPPDVGHRGEVALR